MIVKTLDNSHYIFFTTSNAKFSERDHILNNKPINSV